MATKIKIYFTINGNNFNPDEISGFLGLVPTKIWHKDDYRGGSKLTYSDNGWSMSTNEIESLSVSEEVNKLLKLILPYKEKINSIVASFNLVAELSIVIHIENEERPEVYFDSKLLNSITSLNCSIDIDLY